MIMLGDVVKKAVAPFVKGTKFEHCSDCERRRQTLNKFSTSVADFVSRLFCPCLWKRIWSSLFRKS